MKVVPALLLLLFAAVPAQAAPKLYLFDCGALYLDAKTLAEFSLKEDETPVRELFVPCYLIEHEKGRLLWDAGLPLTVAEASHGERIVVEGYPMSYKRSIVDQLEDIKLEPADIGLAAYSHLHFDHVGAAAAFPATTVLMQKAEWDFATGEGRKYANPELLAAIERQPIMIEGDHDVFGDGSVRIVYAPGHTPGHQVLLVNLEKTGPVVLSGDLYHFSESRVMRRVPTFNFDAAETLRSMDKVEALVEQTGARFWIEHEKAMADTLKKAPEFYQ